MRASRKGIVQRVEQKSLMAMNTRHSTKPRHRGWWNVGCARSQVDDSVAIGSWAPYPLGCYIADQQAVARAAYILFAWRCMADRRGFIAVRTFDHVLVSPIGDVYDVPTDSAWNNVSLGGILSTVRWWKFIPRLDIVTRK